MRWCPKLCVCCVWLSGENSKDELRVVYALSVIKQDNCTRGTIPNSAPTRLVPKWYGIQVLLLEYTPKNNPRCSMHLRFSKQREWLASGGETKAVVRVRCARHKTGTTMTPPSGTSHFPESSSLLYRFHVWKKYDSPRSTTRSSTAHLGFPPHKSKLFRCQINNASRVTSKHGKGKDSRFVGRYRSRRCR